MSKIKNNLESKSILKRVRVSPRKLCLVTDLVRNMGAYDALNQLRFCKKAAAKHVESCLKSAIANAENNHGLDIDSLYISEISVGKAMVMKRIMPRAKGRGCRINKFLSNLYLTVKERKEA